MTRSLLIPSLIITLLVVAIIASRVSYFSGTVIRRLEINGTKKRESRKTINGSSAQ